MYLEIRKDPKLLNAAIWLFSSNFDWEIILLRIICFNCENLERMNKIFHILLLYSKNI